MQIMIFSKVISYMSFTKICQTTCNTSLNWHLSNIVDMVNCKTVVLSSCFCWFLWISCHRQQSDYCPILLETMACSRKLKFINYWWQFVYFSFIKSLHFVLLIKSPNGNCWWQCACRRIKLQNNLLLFYLKLKFWRWMGSLF